MPEETRTVGVEDLTRVVARLFESRDVPSADAAVAAEHLVFADARGIHSHGVMRLDFYLPRFDGGAMNAKTTLTLEAEGPAFARVSAHNGIGQVAASRAVDMAIAKADTQGIGMIVTTDPEKALAGSVLPVGGHKGYATALMVELLTGALAGGGMLDEVTFPGDPDRPGNVSHLIMAINPELVSPPGYADRVGAAVTKLKAARLAPGVDEILSPGEPE